MFSCPPSYAAQSSYPALLRTISVTQVADRCCTLLDSSGRDDSMGIFLVLQKWDARAKPPELEDLVIIVDENYPGNIWPGTELPR